MGSNGQEYQSESPLYGLLNEVNTAASHDLPMIAIAMAVALPDICVSLASSDGRTNPKRYKKWCQDNLGTEFSYVTPNDLYSIRCGVLHNGRFGDIKHSVERVLFSLPKVGPQFVNCIVNDAYIYSTVDFCKNFTEVVFRWCEANKNTEPVKTNMNRLMQYRFNGVYPYITGFTVLA